MSFFKTSAFILAVATSCGASAAGYSTRVINGSTATSGTYPFIARGINGVRVIDLSFPDTPPTSCQLRSPCGVTSTWT